MNILCEFKHDVVGIAMIRDWLGDGGHTVDQATAESRAAICRQCPQHKPEQWWDIHFKDPIARTIRRQLEVKSKVGLRLPDEDSLGLCGVCGCCIKLKAWVPVDYIAKHTTPEQLAEYPKDFCWIRNAIERMNHV